MKREDVFKIIDKHYELNKSEMIIARGNGDENMAHAHAGAMTALKMLKMELNGERKY